jgi:hypothetical protein
MKTLFIKNRVIEAPGAQSSQAKALATRSQEKKGKEKGKKPPFVVRRLLPIITAGEGAAHGERALIDHAPSEEGGL